MDGSDAREELGFDPAEIKAKYKAERDKRVREDGEAQYIEIDGGYAHYIEHDPYVAPGYTRDAINDEIDVAVIGGGFSGLLAGAHLKDAGVTNFRIIEMGGDFGGTWYWNRYPGAQCDIESYCYLPLLEELNYIPKEKYSYVSEIFEHSQRIGKAYGLYERAIFQTQVKALRWDESIKRWRIGTNRNDDIKARFVIMALGTSSRARLPGIPGIESFKGHSFHTARWDYNYTGGDTTGGMTKLADKRVAIIGTGATGIQCIPRTAEYAKHLTVFVRTPSSVDYRGNKPTDPEWAKTLQPGWQRARRANFNDVFSGKQVEDLVADGWTDIMRSVMAMPKNAKELTPAEIAEHIEVADMKKMNAIRGRVDAEVTNKQAAESLKPWYRQMCKRPTFNDEFLPAFNRPNVTLVDVSESKGVERITEKGVVANGVEYEVDCIIYASGFEVTSSFERRIGIPVIEGRDGLSIYEYWQDGYQTLHGFTTRNFPNWFYCGISQNGFSVNVTSVLDDQTKHIAYIINETMKRGASTVQPTQEAQDGWVKTIRSLSLTNRAFQEACTPGYYNNEGGRRAGALNGESYTPGINAFNRLMEEWRAKGDLEGLELS